MPELSKAAVVGSPAGLTSGGAPLRYTESQLVHAPLRVLAVDPGLSGAVALIGRGLFEVRRDFRELRDLAHAIADLSDREPDRLVMEQVHAMPGQGVCSMFSFGRAAGCADGSLYVTFRGKPVQEVTPQCWQKFWREVAGIPKGTQFLSTPVAKHLFPSYDVFKRVKDHNTADAVLMASWAILA